MGVPCSFQITKVMASVINMKPTSHNKEETKSSKSEQKVKTVCDYLSIAAIPLAGAKLSMKIHKLLSKAQKNKSIIKGVKSVNKAIRKKQKGIVLIGGNNTVIDSFIHIPYECEQNGIPYCFLRTSEEISVACTESHKHICVMVMDKEEDVECSKSLKKCLKGVSKLKNKYKD